IAREFPHAAGKTAMMTVSVDRDIFTPQPFDCADGVFRIMFAGRLDEFKDPPMMFRIFADLHAALGGGFEFHYVGMTDPERYAEFAAIREFTIRHGYQTPEGVARIAAQCHAGILTSFFEGMPCYLLETLAAGRPFAAVRLPQFDPLLLAGASGRLEERRAEPGQTKAAMVVALLQIWKDVRAGRFNPEQIASLTEPYALRNQLGRLFDWHRAIARPAPGAGRGGVEKAALRKGF